MSSSVAGSIPCMLAKISLGSSRSSNFTDVIVNTLNYTMSNMSGIQKSAANKLLAKRNIPMPMKGLIHVQCSATPNSWYYLVIMR